MCFADKTTTPHKLFSFRRQFSAIKTLKNGSQQYFFIVYTTELTFVWLFLESSQEIYEKGWEMEVNSHKSERKRCILTKDQLIGLEREFEGTHYVVGRDKFNLAAKLGLSEQQVKVWFQNRRNKWRRERLSHEKQRK